MVLEINLKNINKFEKGGLSGKPLEKKSNLLINEFYKIFKKKLNSRSRELILEKVHMKSLFLEQVIYSYTPGWFTMDQI